MITTKRVFVVTGSNKGIGRSIVKLLLQDKEEKIVYLTSRNIQLGEEAVKDLRSLNLYAEYHQLDITNRKSIEDLRDHLFSKHGGLDVLVNNAGVAYYNSKNSPVSEQVEVTVKVNFFGTLDVCDVLFPILKNGARVVHVSSAFAENAYANIPEIEKRKLGDPNLTIKVVKEMLSVFVDENRCRLAKETCWYLAYSMSKLGLSFSTILQQKEFDKQPERNIAVNSCCPGLVNTDMTEGLIGNKMTPDEGADTPAYLAMLPLIGDVPKGCYVKLRKVVNFPPNS